MTLPSLLLTALLLAAAAAARDLPRIEVSPEKVTLRLGESRQLSARLRGHRGPVRWEVEGEACGTVSPTGLYRAPVRSTTPATVRVTARAEDDPSLFARVLVEIAAVSVEVSPPAATLATGQSLQLRARVEGTRDQRVRWSVDGGPERGAVSEGGLYLAPPRALTPAAVTVRATSLADPSKSSAVAIRLGAVEIEIEPKEAAVRLGGSRRFTANVRGTSNPAVEWEVLGEGQGEISSSGLYTTPESMVTPAVVTIRARAAADPSRTATARVRIDEVGVRGGPKPQKGFFDGTAGKVIRFVTGKVSRIFLPFNPVDAIIDGPLFRGRSGKQYIPLGAGAQLAATVARSENERVRWQIENGEELGEITQDGFYQSPEKLTTPQVVQIRVTSVADPSKSSLYALHIPPVVVQAERDSYLCPLGTAVRLQAAARNSENNRLEWSVEGGDEYGTVTETGVYHPPPAILTPATVRVRAASEADPTKSAVIEVSIPAASVSLSPGRAEVRPGGSVRLKPEVKGIAGGGEVLWTLTPAVGEISESGLYRAPLDSAGEVVQVTAALKADPSKTAAAVIRIRRR